MLNHVSERSLVAVEIIVITSSRATIYRLFTPLQTQRCRYNAVNFLQNMYKRHPIARPLGRGIGVWGILLDPAYDWYSARVPTIIYAISYHIGPRYSGTQLYMFFIVLFITVTHCAWLHGNIVLCQHRLITWTNVDLCHCVLWHSPESDFVRYF